MTVVDVRKDPATRTLTIVSTHDAPPARVWRAWADPERLLRWWFPPGAGVDVRHHDLRTGGGSTFRVVQDGEAREVAWRVHEALEPRSLELDHVDPIAATVRLRVSLDPLGPPDDGCRMTLVAQFATDELMDRLLLLGLGEGLAGSAARLDGVLR